MKNWGINKSVAFIILFSVYVYTVYIFILSLQKIMAKDATFTLCELVVL